MSFVLHTYNLSDNYYIIVIFYNILNSDIHATPLLIFSSYTYLVICIITNLSISINIGPTIYHSDYIHCNFFFLILYSHLYADDVSIFNLFNYFFFLILYTYLIFLLKFHFVIYKVIFIH